MDEWTDGRMDGEKEGQMDRNKSNRTDRQMDEWIWLITTESINGCQMMI